MEDSDELQTRFESSSRLPTRTTRTPGSCSRAFQWRARACCTRPRAHLGGGGGFSSWRPPRREGLGRAAEAPHVLGQRPRAHWHGGGAGALLALRRPLDRALSESDGVADNLKVDAAMRALREVRVLDSDSDRTVTRTPSRTGLGLGPPTPPPRPPTPARAGPGRGRWAATAPDSEAPARTWSRSGPGPGPGTWDAPSRTRARLGRGGGAVRRPAAAA